jgi:hypothetical protein|tara:strand:+ start:686 stop:928 length:243 start_codon:yes stop_codon:yes gene_type:complete
MASDPSRIRRLEAVRHELATCGVTVITSDAGRIEIVSPAWLTMMAERILRALDPAIDAGEEPRITAVRSAASAADRTATK